MFNTFSGNPRRPRQVNLSGRQTNNPFAQAGTSGFGAPGTSHGAPDRNAALANAQQDRLARQQERERRKAAITIQKTWRGYSARQAVKDEERKRWDHFEARAGGHDAIMLEARADNDEYEPPPDLPAYDSESEALSRLQALLHFVDFTIVADISRLKRFHGRWTKQLSGRNITSLDGPWPAAYLRLEQSCINAIDRTSSTKLPRQLFSILQSTAEQIPRETALNSAAYFRALAKVTTQNKTVDLRLVLIPLRELSPAVLTAYENFALHFLTKPLYDIIEWGDILGLAQEVNHNLLGKALAECVQRGTEKAAADLVFLSRTARLSLLGHIIYIYRQAHGFKDPARYASGEDFVLVIGTLLSSLVDEVEIEPAFNELDDEDSERSQRLRTLKAVDPFVREQISSLVNQESVGGLLGLVSSVNTAHDQSESGSHSRVLASYILTLLRLFPRRGDEIRMWLYLGSNAGKRNEERPPVIRFFWQAVAASDVFQSILKDSRTAVELLKPRRPSSSKRSQMDLDDQWRVILIFFELYMFVLKVMDDEEFFMDGKAAQNSRTLRLDEVQAFTSFLKNLGFTMYYNATQITNSGSQEAEPDELSKIFRLPSAVSPQPKTKESTAPRKEIPTHIAGVQGISLDYVKGLVTGLLRQLYARDSRRPFLPTGHWLMTSRFDMTMFIDAVVEEEGKRHQVQLEDDEDEMAEDPDGMNQGRTDVLVGASHAHLITRVQRQQREQRKASRKRYLQAVAPRLEILQNMPFLIPFTTRVQIFRRFVYLDQLKSRHGFVDGELWRMQQMETQFSRNTLERHHGKIRREHEFEDAYEAFFDLGAGLKKPIQITFVDKFNTVEAGIDGGGVTKEFLTSVTNQAFAPTDGIQMFVENDQHLLLPNPSALDELREILREAGLNDNDRDFRAAMQELLKRYEFLGRVIGKCLYEGILVDIGFAGFFLLKWALTGGPGFAGRESGYRPSINDLRDFDEGLYQGLLKLKNYVGDVEDFALDFSITDTLNLPTHPGADPRTKALTRDLKPQGASTPVTNANRLVYISSVARHRLSSQPFHQTAAFLRGLSSIIEPSWLSMFNQSELQTLVGGAAADISIPDLRRHTIYGGVYVIGTDGLEHDSVRIFWAVMEALPDADRRKVLKFVTSTPRAPLLGFGSLNPRFCIRDGGGDETRLPSTSTCVNLLKLPRYSTREACRRKLLQAVNSGAGFDLS